MTSLLIKTPKLTVYRPPSSAPRYQVDKLKK